MASRRVTRSAGGKVPKNTTSSQSHRIGKAVGGALIVFACLWLGSLLLFRLDPQVPRKRYSWEDEEEQLTAADDELEPPRPADVPALWRGPRVRATGGDNVIVFPDRPRDGPTLH